MIVECSKCQTKFKIADEKITPRGVKVRCSKCKYMFVVKPDGVEAVAEKAPKEKAEGIPDDIFKAPTRVEPRPPKTPPPGKKFPLPPAPTGAGPSLADKIDLDSDVPIPAPPKLPEPPPLEEMPTMPTRPPPKAPALTPSQTPPGQPPSSEAPTVSVRPPADASKSNLGDSLFGDLSLESAEKKPPAAPLPAGDDPFAGIDVSAPPPAEPPPKAEKPAPKAQAKPDAAAGPDPVSGEAVGQPTKDLFDDLGDPFAGIQSKGAGDGVPPPPSGQELLPSQESGLPAELAGEPPSPPLGRPQDDVFANIDSSSPAEVGGSQSPAESDDPFAGIDTSVPTDAPAAGKPDGRAGAGSDPFSQLDTSASEGAPGADEDAGPSGLELDSEGKLTGEPLPEPPPPTKAAPVQEAKPKPVSAARPVAASPVSMAAPVPQKTPPSGVLWAYKVGFGLLALVVVLLLFVAYRSGGKPDLTSWSTYVRAFTGEESAEEVAGDLKAVGVKNTAYRTRSGHPLLVVWGKVSNKTKAQKSAVVVSGQLLDEKGEELGKFTAPAGVTFTPREVFDMTDHVAVASAYHSRLEKVLDLKVPPEGDVPFMLVFYDHPEEMEDIRIRVLPKESEDPLRGLPPDTPPAEGQEESFEEEDQPGAKKPSASSAGVVVKKKGTIVRLKPKKGEEPEEEDVEEVDAEEVDVEDVDDVPVEVEEEGDVEDVE